NQPYVSVTICPPGSINSSANCQTIDHIIVDTGSSGLRLFNSTLTAKLPAVMASNGKPLAECGQFITSYTWGAIRSADIYIGGEVARSVSIQNMGDHPNGKSAPSDCAGTGAEINTVAAMGGNGLLGVGMPTVDCFSCLNSAIAQSYYACDNSNCTATQVTNTQVIKNPVSLFAVNNNGVILDFKTQSPSVPTSGGLSSYGGVLYFGINTQSNNTLGSASKYPADNYGTINTNYGGVNYTSFIDSGSNGIFFPDRVLAAKQCTNAAGFYCPSSMLSLNATNIAAGGGNSGNVPFYVENISRVSNSAVVVNAGGTASGKISPTSTTSTFDWGFPFYFGRRVYSSIGGSPYYAY
ncbi:unnamed protein product, partial [Rotaria magnacalcarata]